MIRLDQLRSYFQEILLINTQIQILQYRDKSMSYNQFRFGFALVFLWSIEFFDKPYQHFLHFLKFQNTSKIRNCEILPPLSTRNFCATHHLTTLYWLTILRNSMLTSKWAAQTGKLSKSVHFWTKNFETKLSWFVFSFFKEFAAALFMT